MNADTQHLVQKHVQAATALLQAGLMHMKTEIPDDYSAVALATKMGGFFQINTSISPAGLFETKIDLVARDGTSINLMRVEVPSDEGESAQCG